MKLLLVLFLISSRVYSYTNMIRHGYANCLACHYSPNGGGLLNDYGKGISQALSFSGGEYKESDFKKVISLNGKWEQALQLRLAHLRKEIENVTFPMQGDFLGGAKINKKTFINFNLAKLPERGKNVSNINNSNGFFSEYLIRDIGVVYSLNTNVLFQIARSRIPLGLNIEDHSTYIKRRNKNDTTDLSSQISLIYQTQLFTGQVSFLAPCGQEKKDNQEFGKLFKIEMYPTKKMAVGMQSLYGQSENITRSLQGVFTRIGFLDNFVFLGEINHTHRKIAGLALGPHQWTSYSKFSYFIKEWLEIHMGWEYLSLNRSFKSKSETSSLGTKLSLTRNISLLIDHKITSANSDKDILTMFQIYLNWW